jgi:glycosyltransferase involved in cell wall biosynthesis
MTPAAVAFVSFDSNLFGSERSLLDLLGTIDRARFTPLLILVRPGPLQVSAAELGVEVAVLPWLEGPFPWRPVAAVFAALRLGAWLLERRVRLVDLNRMSFGHLAVMCAAARLARCSAVARARMRGEQLSVPQKLILLGVDRVVSVSRSSIAPWRLGWAPAALLRRFQVIPDGRATAILAALPRDRALLRALGIPDGAPVIGMVGAIAANKRQDLFLAAAEAVLREIPGSWFVVVGAELDAAERPYARGLREFLDGKALAARVVFTGYRADAHALMKNFDALVVPSDHEAFAGVIIEAMALGVPVVAHAVDGTPELMEDGRTGILIDRQVAGDYAAALITLLRDAGLARALAQAAVISVAERFDSAVVARRIERLYDDLLGGLISVAYVSFDSNMFGSERSMTDIMGALNRSVVLPRLILVRPGPLEAAARARNVEVFQLPWLEGPFGANPLRVASASLRLARWLRAHRIQIVELNRLSFGHLAVLNFAAAFAGAKTIVRVRMPATALTRFQRMTLLWSDLILPVSAGAVAAWRISPSASLESRMRVIHNCRNVASLKRLERSAALMRSIGVPENARIVGMVGAISANKRQDLFFAAAETILREIPDAWFVVVGVELDETERAYSKKLLDFLEGKPLSQRVVFTGYRADAHELMKNFDVLIVPSDREAFGGVLIEALALGVPIVAHRVDGTGEVVEDGATGLLIDRQEPAAYAAAALRLLRDPGEADRLILAGGASVDRFDSVAGGRSLEGVYGSLIQTNRGESR